MHHAGGLGFVAMAGAMVLLHLHTLRRRTQLALSPGEAHETRADAQIWGILAATGGASALLAVLDPPATLGLPGWVYMTLAVTVPAFARRANRRRPTESAPTSTR